MGILQWLVFSALCFQTVKNQPLQFLDSNALDLGRSADSLVARQSPGTIASSDFYRRAYHASAVVDNWLYIDGGEFSYMSNGNVTYQYSTAILSIDLSKSWTNSSVEIHSNPKPDAVPNLNNPSLWYYEQDKLLYSGFSGRISLFADQPPPVELQLWSLKPDGAGGGSWKEVYGANNSAFGSMTRSWRPMMAYGSNSAFLLGGTEDFLTTPETAAKIGGEVALPGLVQFNMTTKTFTNSSAAGYQVNGTAERGGMHHVPSFGPDGLFLVMGGDHVDPSDLRDFSTISILDPSSKNWYQQATTGNTPKPRIEFCTAGVNSTNGTYEIFMYAGWNGNLGSAAIAYDEAYVLTLPGFFWIKARYPAAHPRHGLTCNAIGGSQILTIGGVDSNTALTHTGTGLQLDQATFSQTPDPFTQGLAIFDMTTLSFANKFTAPAPPYIQSESVQQYYAQNISTNWSSPAVASLFQITHFTNATTNLLANTNSPTPSSSPSSKPSVAGIAGGVVGGVVGCALIGGLSFLLIKRRRAKQAAAAAPPDDAANGPHDGPLKSKGFHEMYQQPPELGGTMQDEKRAELPEESMFELDGETRPEARGFYEPSKQPVGNPNSENEPGITKMQIPPQAPREEPFHEQVHEAVQNPISPVHKATSPGLGDISPVSEPTTKGTAKKPVKNLEGQVDDRFPPLAREVSPLTGDVQTKSRKKSIKDKDLPPRPPREQ